MYYLKIVLIKQYLISTKLNGNDVKLEHCTNNTMCQLCLIMYYLNTVQLCLIMYYLDTVQFK